LSYEYPLFYRKWKSIEWCFYGFRFCVRDWSGILFILSFNILNLTK